MRALFILLALVLFSCSDERHEINCEFQGGIIIGVHGNEHATDPMFDIKYRGEIIYYVRAYQIDAEYNVGDTINRPCIGGKTAVDKTHGNEY